MHAHILRIDLKQKLPLTLSEKFEQNRSQTHRTHTLETQSTGVEYMKSIPWCKTSSNEQDLVIHTKGEGNLVSV